VRIDLFLKARRLVKRRSLARELCDIGRVLVNSHQSKPAKEVKRGDRIMLQFNTRSLELEVLDLRFHLKKSTQFCSTGSPQKKGKSATTTNE